MNKGGRVRWYQVVFRILGTLILGLVLLLTWLGVFGLPEWATRELLSRVEQGAFSLEAGQIRIHLFRGAVARDVRVYRKKAIGPPFLEAGEMTMAFDPFGMLCGNASIRRVVLSRATFRSATLVQPAESNAPPAGPEVAAGFPDMAPVVLAVRDSVLDDVAVEALSCRLMTTGGVLRIHGIAATLRDAAGPAGTISEGFFTFDPRSAGLSGALTTRLDPRRLEPLARIWGMEATMEWINLLEFDGGPPRCETTIHAQCQPGGGVSVKTDFWAAECRYREVDVLRTDGTVHVDVSSTNCVVSIDPLFVVRPEGTAGGGIRIDSARTTVSFEATSTLKPKALAAMVDVLDNGELDAIEFDGPVKMTGKGSFNWTDQARDRMEGAVRGTDLAMGKLKVPDYSFTVNMTGPTIILDNIHGRFYGGDIRAKAAFFLPYEVVTNGSYMVEASMKNVDFQSLIQSINRRSEDEYEGRLSLRDFKLKGALGAGSLPTMTGSGALRIKNGKLFMLPLFGGLTEVLTRYIPGLDFVVNQSDAKTDFTIADGRIHTDKISIEGSVIRLYGYGDYHLDGKLDFRVQIKFLREKSLAGLLIDLPTWFLSKLFEFHLEGTREAPQWTAFSSTVDLLETVGLRRRPEAGGEAGKDDSSPPRVRGKIQASMEPLPEADLNAAEEPESAPGQERRAR